MYIYSDESGNTGKNIFDEQEYFFQGAILSETDIAAQVCPVVKKYTKDLSVSRLHSKDLPQELVVEIGHSLLDQLEKVNWIFHNCSIHKPYLVPTKFVDTVFDPFENKAVPRMWYYHEMFRHSLCLFFDDIFSNSDKEIFWKNYLTNNSNGMKEFIAAIICIIEPLSLDPRLKQVVLDALFFASKYPDELTLMAHNSKKAYKPHTPNMVGFSSLIHAVHKFCKKHNLKPTAFYHDQQPEFGKLMSEYHVDFGKARFVENDTGFPEELEYTNYDLGEFYLSSSKESCPLQAVDIFLWLIQREEDSINQSVKNRLSKYEDEFRIDRGMSSLIAHAWMIKMTQNDISAEFEEEGRKIVAQGEANRKKAVQEFEKGKKL